MSQEKENLDAYLQTVARLEPEITPIDTNAALASIAISLKRIADALDDSTKFEQLMQAITNGIYWSRQQK